MLTPQCEAVKDYVKRKYRIPFNVLKEMVIESRMTPEQILNWHIPALPSGGGSTQPGLEFQYRDEMETLADVVNSGERWKIQQALGKEGLYTASVLKTRGYATIYRASIYPIIPGSYVSESRQYVEFHREYVNAPEYRIYTMTAPLSSIGWLGDTHEFIYSPSLDEWMQIARARVQKYPLELQNDTLKC